MNLKKILGIYGPIVAGVAMLLGVGSKYFLGTDNPVEEIAEEIIMSLTDSRDVDLSPEDKEDELELHQRIHKELEKNEAAQNLSDELKERVIEKVEQKLAEQVY